MQRQCAAAPPVVRQVFIRDYHTTVCQIAAQNCAAPCKSTLLRSSRSCPASSRRSQAETAERAFCPAVGIAGQCRTIVTTFFGGLDVHTRRMKTVFGYPRLHSRPMGRCFVRAEQPSSPYSSVRASVVSAIEENDCGRHTGANDCIPGAAPVNSLYRPKRFPVTKSHRVR